MALRSSRRFTSLDSIESGMMIQFTYTKKRDDSNESYTVLVIDPKKKHETSGTEHLHGLVINDYNDDELLTLAANIGKNFKYELEEESRRDPLAFLKEDAAYQKFIQYYGDDRDKVYRTFIPERMSSVRQILLGAVG